MLDLATVGRGAPVTPRRLFDEVRQLLDGENFVRLYRLTESYNLGTVLAHGSDRMGRPERELDWHRQGYVGAPRQWSELIYASRDDEVVASLAPGGEQRSSAFKKLDETPDAIVLVYDASAFEQVADRQYAIKVGESFREALRAVLRTTPEVQRISMVSPARKSRTD